MEATIQSHDALSVALATYGSADPALDWSGLLRYDALKAFLVVSDDDSSLGYVDFDTQLLAKEPAGIFGSAAARNYAFYSVCGWVPTTPFLTPYDPFTASAQCPESSDTGVQYQQLSILTRGRIGSICGSPDYGAMLSDFATAIVARTGEICGDLQDNDCDGQTDEGCTPPDSGNQCTTASDCPGSYEAPPVCVDPSQCQGQRVDKTCTNGQCGSITVDDDSACSGLLVSTCGLYPSVSCGGGASQSPPMCATSCSSDAQCDASAYCSVEGQCVPDHGAGSPCTRNAQCFNSACDAGVCQP
jgi:hypothetical protein